MADNFAVDFSGNGEIVAPKHPVASFFHMFFRTGAVIAYILCEWFSDNYVINFVVVVLLLSFDFWTVKNVSGRLLVGLRWWNEVKEDGSSEWIFESRKDGRQPLQSESRLFWISLYAFPAIWVILALASILSPSWLLIVAIALALNFANVIGYTKCQKDAKKNIQQFAGSFVSSAVTQAAVRSFTG
eukprot:Colp12_sorted_trinity150504_noHs@483